MVKCCSFQLGTIETRKELSLNVLNKKINLISVPYIIWVLHGFFAPFLTAKFDWPLLKKLFFSLNIDDDGFNH